MIYFIQEQDGQDSYIKIGFSEDVEGNSFDVSRLEARIDCLQVGNARYLKILAVMKGTLSDEKMIQSRFLSVPTKGRGERATERGEWFFPLPKLMAFIEGLPVYPNLCALSDELGDVLLEEVANLPTHSCWGVPPTPRPLRAG